MDRVSRKGIKQWLLLSGPDEQCLERGIPFRPTTFGVHPIADLDTDGENDRSLGRVILVPP